MSTGVQPDPGRVLSIKENRCIRIQPSSLEVWGFEAYDDLGRLFLTRKGYEWALKMVWGKAKLTLWLVPLFFIALISFFPYVLSENENASWGIAIIVVGFLQALNMLSAKLRRALRPMIFRFDVLFMFGSITLWLFELAFYLPRSRFFVVLFAIFPVKMFFITMDIDGGQIMYPLRKPIAALTMFIGKFVFSCAFFTEY